MAKIWPLLFWACCYEMKMCVDFFNFLCRQGIRRAFCKAKERKIWTFIVGVMVIKGIFFI
jgi:hypothetical protein